VWHNSMPELRKLTRLATSTPGHWGAAAGAGADLQWHQRGSMHNVLPAELALYAPACWLSSGLHVVYTVCVRNAA
jgi:hypothetical protein